MPILKHILAPTDFSPNGSSAIHYACDLAHQTGAKLHLLHVSKKDDLDPTGRIRCQERLNSIIDARSELSLDTEKTVLQGNPSEMITQFAVDQKMDLIVMGTHGRTGLRHLARGSVAERVLKLAPCPVTVLGPQDGKNVTLNHAAAAVEQMISDGLDAGREPGRTQLLTGLMEQLRIPSITALLMLDDLENRGWVTWENESWVAIEGADLIPDDERFKIAMTTDTPAIDLLKRAHQLRATDIHFDPVGDDADLIRFRIDGSLTKYCDLDRGVADHLMNQLKLLADLDTTNSFQGQEGRVRMPKGLSHLEVRLTAAPVAGGHAMALRILDPEQVFRPLKDLGLSDGHLESVQTMLHDNGGLILATGPTGSGKTTTIYSMLETFGDGKRNIVSIESPVELKAPFVRQISVNAKQGLTWTSGLQTVLRMDPDVIFLGEIRDTHAATIAMQAAGSGRHVFSTLHTRDIAGTIVRLLDLELDAASIAANLGGIINQRLVRRLCEQCKEAAPLSDHERAIFETSGCDVPDLVFRPTGCSFCRQTGYHGRVGVFEVAIIDKELRQIIRNGGSTQDIDSKLDAAGIVKLKQHALTKVADGNVSLADATAIHWLS